MSQQQLTRALTRRLLQRNRNPEPLNFNRMQSPSSAHQAAVAATPQTPVPASSAAVSRQPAGLATPKASPGAVATPAAVAQQKALEARKRAQAQQQVNGAKTPVAYPAPHKIARPEKIDIKVGPPLILACSFAFPRLVACRA